MVKRARDELFDYLRSLSNRELAESVDIECSRCPAWDYCCAHPALECQSTLAKWMDKSDENIKKALIYDPQQECASKRKSLEDLKKDVENIPLEYRI